MDYFSLDKPKIKPEDRLAVIQALEDSQRRHEVDSFIARANEPEYKHWELVKHQKPLPTGLTPVQTWYAVKLARSFERMQSNVTSVDDKVFGWVRLVHIERDCHELDLHAGGDLMESVSNLKADERRRFVSKGLMEEAIASAQLEGADTSRVYAQRMLRERIAPRNDSDRMILNNHRAMLAVEKELKLRPLSLDLLLEMHSMLAEGTHDSEGETPRLRRPGEPVEVHDSEYVYHRGPDAPFINKALKALVSFANDDESAFVHPLVKAAMLHFWIGYLHPFTDGNGRLARLLFYWYLLQPRHDYWAIAYLPIAAKIKSGGKKGYTMAYVYSEQDDHDLTYFISYIIRKVKEAHGDFKKHLERARKESAEIAGSARKTYGLNDRQIFLVKYLRSSSEHASTIASYQAVNRVSRATAFNDLAALVTKGLLKKKRIGMTMHYYGTKKVAELGADEE